MLSKGYFTPPACSPPLTSHLPSSAGCYVKCGKDQDMVAAGDKDVTSAALIVFLV